MTPNRTRHAFPTIEAARRRFGLPRLRIEGRHGGAGHARSRPAACQVRRDAGGERRGAEGIRHTPEGVGAIEGSHALIFSEIFVQGFKAGPVPKNFSEYFWNIFRRHMTEGQQEMATAKIYPEADDKGGRALKPVLPIPPANRPASGWR